MRGHKWYIQFPGLSEQEFTPEYKELIFEDKDYKGLFKRRELATDLKITGDVFSSIWDIEKSNDPCTTLPMRLEIFKDGVGFVERWTGYISIKKSKEFDLNNCHAIYKPSTTDIYTCLVDAFEEEIDLFDIVDRQSVNSIIGELETTSCTYTLNEENGFNNNWIDCEDITEGWTLTRRESLQVYEDGTFTGDSDVYQQYTRQFIVQPTQPAPGWINVGGDKWVYTVPARLSDTTKTFNYSEEQGVVIDEVTYHFIYEIVNFEADNAISFNDILDFLIPCDTTLSSEFFGLNTGFINEPVNAAYEYAEDYLRNILVFHASDIINEDASKNATKFIVKRGELLQDIIKMFNLKFLYNVSEDVFMLEHVSAVTGFRGVDFVDQSYNDIKRSYKFTRDEIEIPRIEQYKFKFDTNDENFDDAKITYDVRCSSDSEENISLKQIVTNLSELHNNEEYTDNNTLFSTFLLSVDNADAVIVKDGILNGPLSFKSLVSTLHVFKKPIFTGMVNGEETTFQSIKHTRKQDIEVGMCIDQYFDDFNANHEFKTQLGWGEVESATYNATTKRLKLKLLQ